MGHAAPRGRPVGTCGEGGAVALPRRIGRLLLTLTALAPALLTLGVATAADEEPIRMGPSQAGDTKPLVVAADDVATWPESGEQVILLRGKVLIEQDVVQIRSERAVLWVDRARSRQTG